VFEGFEARPIYLSDSLSFPSL
jgi:hypothetical protein